MKDGPNGYAKGSIAVVAVMTILALDCRDAFGKAIRTFGFATPAHLFKMSNTIFLLRECFKDAY